MKLTINYEDFEVSIHATYDSWYDRAPNYELTAKSTGNKEYIGHGCTFDFAMMNLIDTIQRAREDV